MQAYDSVVIKADVELGGTDQLFNLLGGSRAHGEDGHGAAGVPHACPCSRAPTACKKMSKSYGNYIGLTDEPADMFGKVMSIPDELMVKYYRLASAAAGRSDRRDRSAVWPPTSCIRIKVKRALAQNIVAAYYDEAAAQAAEEQFDLVFKQHAVPNDIPEFAADLTPNDDGTVLPGEAYWPMRAWLQAPAKRVVLSTAAVSR